MHGSTSRGGDRRSGAGFKFPGHRFVFHLAELGICRHVDRIDQFRAQFGQDFEHFDHHLIDQIVEAEKLACDADARASQTLGIERRSIACAGEHAEQQRRVGYGSRHRTRGILAM